MQFHEKSVVTIFHFIYLLTTRLIVSPTIKNYKSKISFNFIKLTFTNENKVNICYLNFK